MSSEIPPREQRDVLATAAQQYAEASEHLRLKKGERDNLLAQLGGYEERHRERRQRKGQ